MERSRNVIIDAAWRARAKLTSRLIPRLNMRPDFIVIGAQKAGTTSLYSWLTQHDDVLAARDKELHYFDYPVSRGPIRRYFGHFPLRITQRVLERRRGRSVVTGEATPYYLFHPLVPARVAEHLPDVKLICLLRDPVMRAISHHGHEVREGNETHSLEHALHAERERLAAGTADDGEPTWAFQHWSYVSRGHYAEQLERWFARFPRSQMLILRYEDLVTDPASVYRQALEFIGVDPDVSILPQFDARNVGSPRDVDPALVKRLGCEFDTSNERLAELTGIDYRTGD